MRRIQNACSEQRKMMDECQRNRRKEMKNQIFERTRDMSSVFRKKKKERKEKKNPAIKCF